VCSDRCAINGGSDDETVCDRGRFRIGVIVREGRVKGVGERKRGGDVLKFFFVRVGDKIEVIDDDADNGVVDDDDVGIVVVVGKEC
jgi:hypothetical protein